MIDRKSFLRRIGLGCLTAPLLKEFGDSAVEQAPEPGLSQREPVRTARVWKWKQQDVPAMVTYTATERTMPGQMIWIHADGDISLVKSDENELVGFARGPQVFAFTAELKNVNMDLFDEFMKS